MTPSSPNVQKTLASVSILRGRDALSTDTSPLQGVPNCGHFSPYAELRSEFGYGKYERRLSVLSNSQVSTQNMDSLIEKTFRMSQSGAYLHHYHKFGLETSHLLEVTFPVLEQVVFNYKTL